ncbi:hypothetical protein ATEG_07230 [Aspergillus terreus NIH2624]|uniref:SAGA-associated factor 11 n=1 Tax=Aspergillus terreus (strain NIH 2624 / FGSC A1156) TaxID=341663 RepID=Q0CGG2_ASPTN|nr:uncharacterized protein ATEG_07230 [Aspergillus terreus NIH2624]EAU32614.1 hypothetical protein ATEG_07230 [Aspergillus terreus NIH2624]
MGEANGSEERGSSLPSGTIAKLTCDILNDTFYNIIHDIVAKVHRDEKVARMRSAVVAARQKAEEEASRRREEAGGKPTGPINPDSEELKDLRVETDGAVFEDGKVYLKGNPLHTTKEIICPDCRLPRLLYPTTGVGARPPPDPYREYCQKQPMISKPGHDVHGNPFATDKLNPKKKKQTNTANTPASSPPTTPDGSFKQAAPEKVSFPTVKCPNCPRYFVVTRVAQHLDRCLGLSGRQVNRNKTPMENGASTPTSAPSKRPLDDETPSALPKKKKLGAPKKLSGKKPPPAPSSKLKNGVTPDMAAAADAASGDGDIKSEANGDNA